MAAGLPRKRTLIPVRWTVLTDSPVLDAAPRLRLPNGMTVIPQSRVEAEHFYDDLFEKRIYARHGIVLGPGDCAFDVGGNIGLFTLYVPRHAPGACCVAVGRNIGMFPLYGHRRAPGRRIFPFEPAPPLFERLTANLRLNG